MDDRVTVIAGPQSKIQDKATKKAEAATAHIKNPRHRQIRINILVQMFRSLDKIQEIYDPDDTDIAEPEDSNGIVSLTREQLDDMIEKKRQEMQATASLLFSTAEVFPATEEDTLNKRGVYGYTPLIAAAVKGDLAECKRLKGLGADLCALDNASMMAWQKAASRGFSAIAKLLKPR